MLNFLLAIALGNPLPSAQPLSPEPPTLLASVPSGLRVRLDKRPSRLQGDFDSDGRTDILQLVAIDRLPNRRITLLSPWRFRQAVRMQIPDALAIYIRHGRDGREFLLYDGDYLSTPQWISDQLPISVVKRGTAQYRRWQREATGLTGDAIVLPTEAGIDILLYWDGGTYRVFYPNEIP